MILGNSPGGAKRFFNHRPESLQFLDCKETPECIVTRARALQKGDSPFRQEIARNHDNIKINYIWVMIFILFCDNLYEPPEITFDTFFENTPSGYCMTTQVPYNNYVLWFHQIIG